MPERVQKKLAAVNGMGALVLTPLVVALEASGAPWRRTKAVIGAIHVLVLFSRISFSRISRLNAEVVRVLRAPEVRDQLTAQGADVVGNSPEEFAAWIKAEVKKWAEVVKVSGAKID